MSAPLVRGLDRCDIWRPTGAPSVEVVSAPIAVRAFGDRLSATLGVCLKRGAPHVSISDGRRVESVDGDVILRPPDCVWRSLPAQVGFVSIDVPVDELPDDAAFGAMSIVEARHLPQFAAALRAFEQNTDLDVHLEATASLLDGLIGMGFVRSRLAADATDARVLRRAREMLRDHLDRPISLEQLSAHSGVNKFALIRRFRREIGLTPHAFHLQMRVHHARDLLARGVSASETSLLTGFADQSHLGRWFKRIVGVSPGMYAGAVRRRSRAVLVAG